MLGLLSDTNPKWVSIVEKNLDVFLSDHLYAEQKAASNGFSFVMQYPEQEELIKEMAAYALEETEHFKRVLNFMQKRAIPLKKDEKSMYVNHLRRFFTKSENKKENLANRLLIAGMIEARSCERFAVLSKHTTDTKLASFYHELIAEEVGHYKLFYSFAKSFQSEEIVLEKWNKFLIYEAAYMNQQGKLALVHG